MLEIDSILADPSIRDSLRSDGYYQRHKQKAQRPEQPVKESIKTTFKNIPLSFIKSLNTPGNSVQRTMSPRLANESTSSRLKTHIARRASKQKQATVGSLYSAVSPNSNVSYSTFNSISNSVKKNQTNEGANMISNSTGSFNSSVNSKQAKENILNTKFNVNSNFLNKLQLKNLNTIVSRNTTTTTSQPGLKRVIGYQQPVIKKTTYTNNPTTNSKLLHLTLNTSQAGTNVVQINNYVSAGAKAKEQQGLTAPSPMLSKIMSGPLIQQQPGSVRNLQVKETIRRTGYRDTTKLNQYRKILNEGYHDDYSQKAQGKLSTTDSKKKPPHSWKMQFESLNKQQNN